MWARTSGCTTSLLLTSVASMVEFVEREVATPAYGLYAIKKGTLGGGGGGDDGLATIEFAWRRRRVFSRSASQA